VRFYDVLDELSARGVTWLTLRKRGRTEIERINALPATAWSRVRIHRAGRYRNPHLHDETIRLIKRSLRRQARRPHRVGGSASGSPD
jgi:hypothetical protein